MKDKEITEELFEKQSQIAVSYNQALFDSVTPEFRSNLLSLLNEEHQLQEIVIKELLANGWTAQPKAEQGDISALRHTFSQQGGKS